MLNAERKAEYFAPVDGLRAVAVLAVIAFHFGELIPAGFVGVDIFFVISGFVVTGAALSMRDRTLTGFLLAFYARRVLRIVPALLACLLVTFALMVLFVPIGVDGRFTERNVLTGFAALVGLSNFVLAGGASDYWSPAAELNPFTHTWSLAVEEQFYFVAPFILIAYLRGHRRAALIGLATLAATSLALAAYWGGGGVHGASNRAFYLLPSRFWELAVGVGLFITISRWRPWLAGKPGAAAGSVGAVALVLSFVLAKPIAFPWPWALLPVAGSALLIASVVATPSTWIARLLSTKLALWIGKRSYAMYLWHWPLIVVARWTVGDESPWVVALVVLLTLGCAQLSKSLVEDPARRVVQRLNWRGLRVVATGAVGAGFAASAMAGAVVARPWLTLSVTGDQADWNYSAELPSNGCAVQRSTEGFAGGYRMSFVPQGCNPVHRTVYVAGDSHAGAYSALLRKLVSEAGVRVQLFAKPGCPVLGLRRPAAMEAPDCAAFVDAVLQKLSADVQRDDLVFLPGLRIPRFVDYAGQIARAVKVSEAERVAAAEEARRRLMPVAERGARVVFEAPKPVFKAPPFRCGDWFNRRHAACASGTSLERSELEQMRQPVLTVMTQLASRLPGARVLDPADRLCTPQRCDAVQNGRPVFFDADHLSGYGNAMLYQDVAQLLQ